MACAGADLPSSHPVGWDRDLEMKRSRNSFIQWEEVGQMAAIVQICTLCSLLAHSPTTLIWRHLNFRPPVLVLIIVVHSEQLPVVPDPRKFFVGEGQ